MQKALKLLVVGGLLLATTAPALAQERSPADRQTLVELAYTLGPEPCPAPDLHQRHGLLLAAADATAGGRRTAGWPVQP